MSRARAGRSFLLCSEAGSFLEALLLALDEEAPVGPYVPEAFRVLAPVKAYKGLSCWLHALTAAKSEVDSSKQGRVPWLNIYFKW